MDRRNGISKLAKMLNFPEDQFYKLMAKYAKKIDLGKISWSSFEKIIKQHSKNKIKGPLLKSLVSGYVKIEVGHQLAKDLSQKYPLGLLSDVALSLKDETFKQGLIPNLEYQAKIFSAEVGAIKPSAEIFKIAAEAAAVAPENIFFIDDLPANIVGAEQVGWQGYVFNPDNPQKSVADLRKLLL